MSKQKQLLAVYLSLAVVTLLAFWQVHYCDFINFDDPEYVTENSQVLQGITADGLQWAFTTGHASNWHPLTWISHMLDVQLFGLNPRWHHVMNLLLHVANALLLFFVLLRMSKALWPSAVVAALFALHPLHVESVAWVSERKDVLSAFFWMLTMGAYVYYVEFPNRWRYSAVLLFFGLGLLAKPMLVTLPFVFLLLDYWPLRRFGQTEPALVQTNSSSPAASQGATLRSLIWEKAPLFALTIASSIVTVVVQQKGGMVESLARFPLEVRVENAFISYITYIAKTIWPMNLAFLYPYPTQPQFWSAVGAVLLFLSITILVIRATKKFPYLIVGWFWYVGVLLPVIGFIQLALQARADRYTYLPQIGLFIMAAWGIPELIKKWRYQRAALVALSTGALVLFFLITGNQVAYWKNSFTLYDHTIKITEDNFLAYGNRGYAYARSGDYQQAIADYDRSIAINPNIMMVHFNRGYANYKFGNYKQAILDYDRAIEIAPQSSLAYLHRGNAYAAFGQPKRALADYDNAIERNPYAVHAYLNRAYSYHDLGNDTRAIMNYDRAIELEPNNAEAYYNRAISYAKLGNQRQAIADYTRALAVNPKFAEAYYNRGNAYKSLDDRRQAIADYTRALEVNPQFAPAYYNRAVARNDAGKNKQAMSDLKTAAALGMIPAQNYLKSQGIRW